MPQIYETNSELEKALEKRGVQVTQEELESVLKQLELRSPFGPEDLKVVACTLGPERRTSSRILRTDRILSSDGWGEVIVA